MPQTIPLLSAQHLSCLYGHRHLFADLSFDLQKQELLWVVGQNGAGKTSLLNILTGIKPPNDGCLLWQGTDITAPTSDYYQQMLWLGHRNPFKPELTAEENLRLLQSLRPHENMTIQQALERVELYKQRHKQIGYYSAGMQRRLALASLLLSPATLWILDEPQAALDVQGIALCESLLTEFIEQGGSVVMTSHHDLNLPTVNMRQLDLRNPS